ncbi:MAG: M16 family metallopeptidase, partial [Nocardioidaceae bacterium]
MTVISSPPTVTPALEWRFPTGRKAVLDNGIRLLAYHCPGQFVISASLVFDVPLNAEPRDREGVAGLTGRCLTAGAAGRSAEEFSDALALCGADLDAAATPDGFAVRMSVPVVHLDVGLGLMADAVIRPALAEQEFAHERRLRLQEIEQARAYPTHVAAEQMNAALFGSFRAARPVGGDAAGVGALTRGDVAAFAAEHLQPRSATMIIAGDFTDLDPVALVTGRFGEWSRQGDEIVMPEQ